MFPAISAAGTSPPDRIRLTRRRIIRKEFLAHGATAEQAEMYCDFVEYFEDLSKDRATDGHHVLPRNCGWWNKYRDCKWNTVLISHPLHISLHAVLWDIFPTNQALFQAARITSSKFCGDARQLRLKPEIIRLYQRGRAAIWIGNLLGVPYRTLLVWLKRWETPMRSASETNSISRIGNKKYKHKSEIIRMYRNGKTAAWIGKQFKFANATVIRWLKAWGVQTRSRTEAWKMRRAA
jgi:transposase-like protein